jgi:long-subunit acyl-CoA synthetase (AMP-forming)
MVFQQYHHNEVATRDSFTADGWFKTGDKGLIDAEGVLVLGGRSKDSLIINGVKYITRRTHSLRQN